MSDLSEFLGQLFEHGRAVVPSRPGPEASSDPAAAERLRAAHRRAGLDLAGPPVPLDEPAALAAARVVRLGCWFLVNHDEPPAEVERAVRLDRPAKSWRGVAPPATDFAADLTLRYLAGVHRRARARAPDDVLTRRLTEILREWPLSGVLAEIAGPPAAPPDLGGHAGVSLLYAERLARRPRPGWVPAGPGFEHVDWVFRELGLEASPLLLPTPERHVDETGEDDRD